MIRMRITIKWVSDTTGEICKYTIDLKSRVIDSTGECSEGTVVVLSKKSEFAALKEAFTIAGFALGRIDD